MSRLLFRLQNDLLHQLKHHIASSCRNVHASSMLLANKVVPFKLSDIGEGIKEVEVKEWFVQLSDEVAQFDDICEVQSDKASVVITSRYDGKIKKLHYEVGDVAQVGDPLVDIEIEGEVEDEITAEVPKAEPPTPTIGTTAADTALPTSTGGRNKVLATPAVRNLAKLNNIDITTLVGSGAGGRVMKEDVLPSTTTTPIPQTQHIPPPPPMLAEDRTEKVKGIRKAMWTSMTASLTVPHFGYDDEYDLTSLVKLRSQLKDESKRLIGSKLSYMPFILKACSLSLAQYPIINSHIDVNNESVVYKGEHNIGVAVDTEHGLLLPCVKQIQNLSILEIATELNRLQKAGASNKLSPSDLTGGTFSLSNIGSIGGTYARPVIFSPQVAIGALGKIQKLPRFGRNNEIVEKRLMCVSWSADHRIIEGATMARFSNQLKSYLENPETMLLHLK